MYKTVKLKKYTDVLVLMIRLLELVKNIRTYMNPKIPRFAIMPP
jgi:hypothetical protein